VRRFVRRGTIECKSPLPQIGEAIEAMTCERRGFAPGERKEKNQMFPKMRRGRQALPEAACEEILERGTSGVLAVSGDEGYPYAVPLSYVYQDGRIIFHSAKSGHKLDAIARDERVSFCVIDRDEVVPEGFTTYFASVIAFGKAKVVEDEGEKRAALELLAEKYGPDDASAREEESASALSRVCIFELEIDHLTGKQAIELVRAQG